MQHRKTKLFKGTSCWGMAENYIFLYYGTISWNWQIADNATLSKNYLKTRERERRECFNLPSAGIRLRPVLNEDGFFRVHLVFIALKGIYCIWRLYYIFGQILLHLRALLHLWLQHGRIFFRCTHTVSRQKSCSDYGCS